MNTTVTVSIPPVPATGAWVRPDPKAVSFTGKTRVYFILDRSDSMSGIRDEVISGFNEIKSETLKVPGSYTTTVILFNTDVDVVVAETELSQVANLDRTRYVPQGMTALNDALAQAIHMADKAVRPGDRVLMIPVTDGQENRSVEFSRNTGGTQKIRDMIREREGRGNWTFTYLSASPDAFADADSYGIKRGNTQAFSRHFDDPVRDRAETLTVFGMVGQSVGAYASSSAASLEDFYGGNRPAKPGDAAWTTAPTEDAPTPWTTKP